MRGAKSGYLVGLDSPSFSHERPAFVRVILLFASIHPRRQPARSAVIPRAGILRYLTLRRVTSAN